jgi:hypothetical protein
VKLLDHIEKHYSSNQAAFAKAQGVKPQQVTKWLNMNCIVVEGVLYSPRRELIKVKLNTGK